MKRARVALLALVLPLLSCEGPHLGFPWDFERMIEQARAEPYGESRSFADGMTMRTPPEGAVPFRASDARWTDDDPEPITRDLLEEGQRAFDIVCAACHGLDGEADTPVAAAMRLRPPPSLHEPGLRALSAAEIGRVIEEGYGLMPSYASHLDAHRRRAVVAYVRTLQRSRDVRWSDLPPAFRAEAAAALGTPAFEVAP